MYKKTTLAMALACSALLLTACGKNDAPAPAAPPPVSQAPAPAPETTPAPAAPAPVAEAPAAAPAAAPAGDTPAPVANADAGKGVYNKTCALCHAAGVAGAPKPGDKDDWGPRIAQGKDTLYKHAIEGFTGTKGVMPARGGASSLSDDEVKSAVDYMVSLSS
ncbi:Cytochrome c5 [Oryzisolibacter propanilivorax]|uniref:Cytochrome c5 n=1 Tax=Oryzisolibacter propanilivorax TaxID=1527607 RepID=A0A1G9TBX8_9BURK|nr:c-type cytochrome [Oryzisolibacter propanilivorax]SDM45186.1 Cytochrome c5 [Oryzisolibacter propanilivorax]